jgi:UDP-N-acetylmuramoyl-L-alanyl-D-glutamate--2,6-diaminopimelate ligase
MKLSKLIEGCKVINIRGDKDAEVESITSDSRNVVKGSLFIAVEGIFTDGHSYIGKAIEQDATVVVYDKPLIEEYFPLSTSFIELRTFVKASGVCA